MLNAMLLFLVSTFGISNINLYTSNEFETLLTEEEVCDDLMKTF